MNLSNSSNFLFPFLDVNWWKLQARKREKGLNLAVWKSPLWLWLNWYKVVVEVRWWGQEKERTSNANHVYKRFYFKGLVNPLECVKGRQGIIRQVVRFRAGCCVEAVKQDKKTVLGVWYSIQWATAGWYRWKQGWRETILKLLLIDVL